MKENTTPAKSAMSYGVVFGVIMILEFVLMYALDLDPVEHGWVGTLANVFNFLIFPLVFITLACNNFKKMNGGYITFSQSLKAGVATMAIGGLLYGVFTILFNIIFPSFRQNYLKK